MWHWLRWVWPVGESHSWTEVVTGKAAAAAGPMAAAGLGGSESLHSAALEGDVELLRERLLRPDADVNARDEQKSTPLHLAAKNGHGACVALLLQRREPGARLDLRDRWGRTALHSAVVWCRLDVACQLLRSCDRAARIKDDEGKTVLHTACAMGLGLTFLDELLKQGADVNALDMRQWTPLMCAIAVQNYTVAEFLLLRGRADPNVPLPDRASTTALRLAVEKCNLPLVQLLLRHGARVDVGSEDRCGTAAGAGGRASSCRRPASAAAAQPPPAAIAGWKKSDVKNMATISLSHASDAKPASLHIVAAILHAGAVEPEWDALWRFYGQFVRNSSRSSSPPAPGDERQRLLRYVVELSVAAGLDVSRQAVSKAQRRYGLTPEVDGWLLGLLSRQRLKSLRHSAALAVRDAVRDTNVGNLTSALLRSDQPRLVADLVTLRHM